MLSFFLWKRYQQTQALHRRSQACQTLFKSIDLSSEPWRKSSCFFIAHAAGGIDGYTYTNSLEALQKSIAQGYRLIELDLSETNDGHLVGVHSWSEFKKMAGFSAEKIDDQPLSLEEFKKQKLYERYTPVVLSDVSEIFFRNPELILVSDKTRNLSLLKSIFPSEDRLIPEVFSNEEFLRARQMGFKNLVLTLEDVSQFDFIRTEQVKIVTASTNFIRHHHRELQILIDEGLQVWGTGTNAEQDFATQLGYAATAFYVDFWNIKTGRCENKNCE